MNDFGLVNEEYKNVLIWSGWLRVSHWSIAIAVLILLATGWLIGNAPYLAEPAIDIHYLAASFLVFGMLVRFVLLFSGAKHEQFSGLIPDSTDIRNMGRIILFYVSLGKSLLPSWYAHNPLWKPVYLFLYLALVVQIMSGSLIYEIPLLWRFYMPGIHETWSVIIFWLCAFHIASVVLQDAKGMHNDVSSMLHGYRLFRIQRTVNQESRSASVNFVSLDDLK